MTTVRDNTYWAIYKNLKAKNPKWSVRRLHAATGSIMNRNSATKIIKQGD